MLWGGRWEGCSCLGTHVRIKDFKIKKIKKNLKKKKRRKRQPTPVFLPGKSRGQRSLVGYSPWDHRRVRHDLATKQQKNRALSRSKVFNL